jgi:DNA invertase Pin-like site-specific DNA recombinase
MREGGGRIESYRKTNKITQADIDEIVNLRRKNIKALTIAIETGFSISTVNRHIKNAK